MVVLSELFLHKPSGFRNLVSRKADEIDACGQVGGVDFHLVGAAFLAIDQSTHEVVDFNSTEGVFCHNGQLVVDRVGVDDKSMNALFAEAYSMLEVGYKVAAFCGDEVYSFSTETTSPFSVQFSKA